MKSVPFVTNEKKRRIGHCEKCGRECTPYAFYPLKVVRGRSEGICLCSDCVQDFTFNAAGKIVQRRTTKAANS